MKSSPGFIKPPRSVNRIHARQILGIIIVLTHAHHKSIAQVRPATQSRNA